MKKPTEVNILGSPYSIEYKDNPVDVDIDGRASLWGQIDYWTNSIRIYDKDRPMEEILESLLHEILHGIEQSLHQKAFEGKHDELDILALALTDVLVRNGWLKE